MSLPIQNTTNTNTFEFWKNRTNDMADAFTKCVVTTDANSSSVAANGSAAILGDFTANSFYGNGTIKLSNSISNAIITTTTLYLGNTDVSINISSNTFTIKGQTLNIEGNTSANIVVTPSSLTLGNSTVNVSILLPNSASYNSGQHFLNANGSWVSVGAAGLMDTSIKTTTTTLKTIDNFDKVAIRAAEYLVSVIDNSANNRQTSKLMVTHDDGIAYVTEYAQHVSNTLLGNFTAAVLGSEVVLYLNLTGTASANVKYTRIVV